MRLIEKRGLAAPSSHLQDYIRSSLKTSLRDLSDEPIRELKVVPVLHQHVIVSPDPNVRQLNQSRMTTGSVDGIHVARAKSQTRLPSTCGVPDHVVAVNIQNRWHLLVAVDLRLCERRTKATIALEVNHHFYEVRAKTDRSISKTTALGVDH